MVAIMKWLDRLSRRFRYGIPNLMLYITATMLVVFALGFLGFDVSSYLDFNWALILRGQIWRIFTFIALPPASGNILFTLISMYFYYFIGNSLENEWGPDRFTLYYIFGVVGLIIAGILTGASTNYYLNMSLFFAFATLYPEHKILLFFVIPVKIKWLAWLDAAFFAFSFLQGVGYGIRFGDWSIPAAILFSLINYFLFFGPDLWRGIQDKMRYSKSRRNFREQMRQGQNQWR
jgi:hypothetical protein